MQPSTSDSARRARGRPATLRISAGDEWFPEFVFEVVSHRVGDLYSVTLIATGPAYPRAFIEHFPVHDGSATAIRDWLLATAIAVSGLDDRILDWAYCVSERIVVPAASN